MEWVRFDLCCFLWLCNAIVAVLCLSEPQSLQSAAFLFINDIICTRTGGQRITSSKNIEVIYELPL